MLQYTNGNIVIFLEELTVPLTFAKVWAALNTNWLLKLVCTQSLRNALRQGKCLKSNVSNKQTALPEYKCLSKTYFIIRLLRSWSSPSRNSYLLVRDSEISVFASWFSVLSLLGSLGSTAPSPKRKHILLQVFQFSHDSVHEANKYLDEPL